MKNQLLSRKRLTTLFYSLCLMLCVNLGWGQQVIGSFPYMNGGFEGQTAAALGTTVSSTVWSRQSQAGSSSSIVTATPRTGLSYATVTANAAASRNLQSPQLSPFVAGSTLTASTSYTVQYWIKNAATVAAFQVAPSTNGTANPTYSTAATMAINAGWTKYTNTLTTASTVVASSGIAVIGRATIGTFDIDDVVIYPGTVEDVLAPDAPTSPSITNVVAGVSQTVSWSATGTGVDGGGYMVVRNTTDPSTAPNANGIYAVGNFITGTDKVVYIGTGTTFSDALPAAGNYYYRIYAVDKAFNYSAAPAIVNNDNVFTTLASLPSSQTSNLTIGSVTSSSLILNFTAGDGAKSLVVMSTSPITSNPVNGVTYTTSANIAGGTRVVYIGAGISVPITGLARGTTYYVKVYTFNGSAGSENFLTTSPASGSQFTLPGEIVSTGTLSVTPGVWTATTSWVGGVVPTQYDNVTIAGSDVVNVTTTAKCYNLTIPSGAKVWSNTVASTLQIYGTSLACAGTFGDPNPAITTGSALTIEFGGNLTISGSGAGAIFPLKIRPVTGLSNIGVTFDATTTLTYPTVCLQSDNTGNDNVTFTINSGTTVTLAGSLSTTSSSAGVGSANTTLTVNGTLNILNNINTTVAIGKTYTVNVVGAMTTNKLNITPLHAVQAPSITVTAPGSITATGTVDASNTTIAGAVTGTGTFTLNSLGTIQIAAPSGLEPVAGPIRTTTRNFSTGANYTYSGTTAQVPGSDFPATVNNLTVNNAAGLTLAQSVTVNGILNLTSGIVATNTNVLTTGATATVSNASAISYVNGNLNKFIAASSTTKNFEIGDAAVYAPISIDFAGTVSNSTGTIQASTASGDHASISSSNFFADKTVNRTWTLTNGVALTDLTSYSPTFTFVSGDLDVSATTNNFVVGNYNSPTWTYPTVGTKTATSTQATGVTSFGSFAVGEALAPSTITVTGTTSFTYSGLAQGPSASTVTGSTGAVTYSYVGVNATSYGPSATAPTNLGTYTATASLAADANYLAAISDAFAFSIVLATPVVTPTIGTYTYSGSAQGPNAATNTGTGTSYTFSYEGVSSVYGPSTTAPINAGTYTVTVTVAADGIYGSASSSATAFTIATATATITVTVDTYTYNGSEQGPTAVSGNTGSGTVTWSYEGTGSTSYPASVTLPTDAGTYTATASVAANGNYGSASSVATAFTIATATATITVTVGSYTYNGSEQGPTAVSGNTGSVTVTWSYAGTGSTSYPTSVTLPTDAGTYTATASVAANGNYGSASSSATAFTIATATATITVTVGTYTYNGSGQGPTAVSGNTGSGTVTWSYAGTGSTSYPASVTLPTAAGTYTATASVAANGNYGTASSDATAFAIGKASSTITVTGTTSFTYTGSAQGPSTSTVTGSTGAVTYSYVGVAPTVYLASDTRPTNAGTYTATASVAADANYLSASSSATTFTIDKATLTITANGQSKCAGSSFTFAGTEFITSTLLGSDAVSTVSLSSTGAGSGAAGGSYAIVASNATGTGLTNYTISYVDGSLTVSTSNTWTGTINNNWSNAGNWSCGVIPGAGTAISITSGNPVLDVDYTVSGSLTLSGAATLSINPLKTLSVSISGTANFGGNLVTVKSDNSGSGSIGVIAGALNGATNVTVERYIPNNNFRSWRLLAAPTYGSGQTINQAWQEGNAALINNTPGYGTQITSPSGTGFDGVSLNPSMYRYNGTALEEVTNTGDAIATNQGYFLYVRGDRSIGMSSSTSTNTPTTLRTNGTLHKGTQTSANILANNYGLVGNPFASAINFLSLQRTGGVTNAFYIWDAKKQSGNSLGMYQTFSETNAFVPTIDGGSYSTVDPNTAIQSGQAFFVYADATAGTVQIPESSKVASTGTLGYKNVSELVKIDSRLYSIAGTATMADANVVVFDAAYSNAVDGNDAVKFSNNGENLGILKSGKTLTVEGRQPVIIADTIFFNMWNMQAHAYQLELIPQNLGAQNLVARLEDSYLNTSTTVNLLDTTRVAFAVNATPASYVSNRFRIVFTPTVVLPVNFISIAASRKATNVQVNWKVGNEVSIRQYEVERSTDGRNYTKAGTVAVTGNSAYGLLDANAPAGTLFYRVKSVGHAGEIKYSAVVKVAAENVKPGYAVVPNPIEGAEINIQFKNQAAGKYSIKLLNNAGQQILSTEVNYAGGNGTQTIQIPAGLARGAYQLEIISADKTSSTQSIFINHQ